MKNIFGGQISYIDLKSKRFFDALIESYSKSKKDGHIELRNTDTNSRVNYTIIDPITKNKRQTYKIESPNQLKTAIGQYLQSNPSIPEKEQRLIMSNLTKLIKGQDIVLNENISSTFITNLNRLLSRIRLSAKTVGSGTQQGQPSTNNTLQNFRDQIEEANYIYIGSDIFKQFTNINITQYPNIFSDLKERELIYTKNIDNRYIFKVDNISDSGGGIDLIVKPLFVRYNAKGLTLGATNKFNTEFSFLKIKLHFTSLAELNSVWNNSNNKRTIRPISNDFVSAVIKELFATNVNAAETSLWIKSWFKDPILKKLYNQDKTVQKLVGKIDKNIDSFNTNIGRTLDNILQRRNQKERQLILKFGSNTDYQNFIRLEDSTTGPIFLDSNGRSRVGVYLKNQTSANANPFVIINSPYIKKENGYFKVYVEGNLIEIPEQTAASKKFDHIKFNNREIKTKDITTGQLVPITLNTLPEIR